MRLRNEETGLAEQLGCTSCGSITGLSKKNKKNKDAFLISTNYNSEMIMFPLSDVMPLSSVFSSRAIARHMETSDLFSLFPLYSLSALIIRDDENCSLMQNKH